MRISVVYVIIRNIFLDINNRLFKKCSKLFSIKNIKDSNRLNTKINFKISFLIDVFILYL